MNQSESETISTTKKISDTDLENLRRRLQDASITLKFACLSLQSCYVANASSVEEFVRLRKRIKDHAKVYSEKVLPFANLVIQNIQTLIEPYMLLTFEDFKESIQYLAAETDREYALSVYTKELHIKILESFKGEQKAIDTILEKLEDAAQKYKKQIAQLQECVNSKYSWAIDLALIPVVNLIAKPLLIDSADKDLIKAIANDEESKLAVFAAYIIKNVFSTSITNFVNDLTKIAKFFSVLKNELSILDKSSDDQSKELHYNKFQKIAKEIIQGCKAYIAIIPSCITDLQAIPDDFDKIMLSNGFPRQKLMIVNQHHFWNEGNYY
ncbi:25047_t:CDS:1 [Gigaspora margarita]|uniref:25047_t:CDS:1 n=1 Tax=Gigaspora margarita TaxID=4874 RepID=A0ABM8VXC9_GIGMA|nr:25047_t:CDS:1 [Gigaspora margarita]